MIQDNGGFTTSPDVRASQPVISQTALQLTNASADTNTTATVVAGKRYRFTSTLTGGFVFGLADPTTAGNVRWVCPIYGTIEIQIPDGYTSLYYATNVNDGIGYLVEIKQAVNIDPAK